MSQPDGLFDTNPMSFPLPFFPTLRNRGRAWRAWSSASAVPTRAHSARLLPCAAFENGWQRFDWSCFAAWPIDTHALLVQVPFSFGTLQVLPATVGILIGALDPAHPALRRECLPHTTLAIKQLIERFPAAAFFQPDQQLAIGTTDALVEIYDLRTATKSRILEVCCRVPPCHTSHF